MATYQLHLKGFVGGWDFDADYVDYILGKNKDKEVHVLIDSLGGRVNTALSIYNAFKLHGNVHVHLVGMNASAATIASMGAKSITMDRFSLYLVHKCSVEFFKWTQANSDDLTTIIENIQKEKEKLDKIDATAAEMYASRCKKSSAELLELMKKGGWMNAAETKEWGFVDEITDLEEDAKPVLNQEVVSCMVEHGMPIPATLKKEESFFARLYRGLNEYFNKSNENTEIMKKKLTKVGALLETEEFEMNDGKVTMTEEQLDKIESALAQGEKDLKERDDQIETLKNEVAELKKSPGEETKTVVTTKAKEEKEEGTVDEFMNTVNAAHDLMNEIS